MGTIDLDTSLRRLAARACEEAIPKRDVSAHVVSLLTTSPAPVYALERPLLWMAGLSSAVALSVVAVALFLHFGTAADPLREVLETVSWASLQ